jgi:hypothetical protein
MSYKETDCRQRLFKANDHECFSCQSEWMLGNPIENNTKTVSCFKNNVNICSNKSKNCRFACKWVNVYYSGAVCRYRHYVTKIGLYTSRRKVCSPYPLHILNLSFVFLSSFLSHISSSLNFFVFSFPAHFSFSLSFYFLFIVHSFSVLLSFFLSFSLSLCRMYVSCINYFILPSFFFYSSVYSSCFFPYFLNSFALSPFYLIFFCRHLFHLYFPSSTFLFFQRVFCFSFSLVLFHPFVSILCFPLCISRSHSCISSSPSVPSACVAEGLIDVGRCELTWTRAVPESVSSRVWLDLEFGVPAKLMGLQPHHAVWLPLYKCRKFHDYRDVQTLGYGGSEECIILAG